MKELGEWDDDWQFNRKDKKTRDWIRIARYAIYGGFVIVAIVVLLVFIPRAANCRDIRNRRNFKHHKRKDK